MNIENWELETDLSYTFEFSYKPKPSIIITITARNEEEAWKLLSLLK